MFDFLLLYTCILSYAFFTVFSFGVMNDGFVLVKLEDGKKRKSRHMKVAIIADNQKTSHSVQISQITWFNLGGSELTTDKHVSIKVRLHNDLSHSWVLTQNSKGKQSALFQFYIRLWQCCIRNVLLSVFSNFVIILHLNFNFPKAKITFVSCVMKKIAVRIVWLILHVLELVPLGVNNWGEATPLQACCHWYKVSDQILRDIRPCWKTSLLYRNDAHKHLQVPNLRTSVSESQS